MPDRTPRAAALSAPIPTAPVDGAVVPLDAATFRWSAPPGAAAFDLRIAPASAPDSPVVDLAALPTTEATVADALPSGPCVWWVRREGGPWSAAARFVAGTAADLEVVRQQEEAAAERQRLARREPAAPAGPPPAPVWPHATGPALSDAAPLDWATVPGFGAPARADPPVLDVAAPSVRSPLGGEVVDAAAVALQWTAVPGAIAYDVELSPDPSFEALVLALDAGPATEIMLPNLVPAAGHRLLWRVRARTPLGATPWSRYGRFYPAPLAAVDAFHTALDAALAAGRRRRDYDRLARDRELALLPTYERNAAVEESGTAVALLVVMVATMAAGFGLLLLSALF
ncbi:hypothetical protein [Rubrivirga sp. IMCC45206]|uniref:hypothetical protein n=1 Tax=Rubrivirga sp. IMCC45206 TaxID=3391614 RepID=UPI0039901391